MEVVVTLSWQSNEVIGLGLTCYPHIRYGSQLPTYQASLLPLPTYWPVLENCLPKFIPMPIDSPTKYLPFLDLDTLIRSLKVITCRTK